MEAAETLELSKDALMQCIDIHPDAEQLYAKFSDNIKRKATVMGARDEKCFVCGGLGHDVDYCPGLLRKPEGFIKRMCCCVGVCTSGPSASRRRVGVMVSSEGSN